MQPLLSWLHGTITTIRFCNKGCRMLYCNSWKCAALICTLSPISYESSTCGPYNLDVAVIVSSFKIEILTCNTTLCIRSMSERYACVLGSV